MNRIYRRVASSFALFVVALLPLCAAAQQQGL